MHTTVGGKMAVGDREISWVAARLLATLRQDKWDEIASCHVIGMFVEIGRIAWRTHTFAPDLLPTYCSLSGAIAAVLAFAAGTVLP